MIYPVIYSISEDRVHFNNNSASVYISWQKVIKTKRLERLLEVKLDEKIYNEIRGVIIDKSEQNKKD